MKTLTIALFSLLSLAYAGEPVCQQCDYRPGYNLCDITTSCTFVWGHDDPSTPAPYYCACRAGYRADNCDAGDTTKQFRLPWYGTPGGDPSQQGRVFVKPGLSCNTLCDDYTLGKDGCKAVQELDSCL
ncbi:hypothetical protein COCC4DRAFT_200390 [Bipolaris maydis ATCC 48331]|uniref:EGF-like domain-containing protein n=2 Tax=Cochliobolus heterostrophus TaxID=5016 RepID=M2UJ99_COCH5|nr:uncharacterized protein COCC4DRAFT_200390 [Bipolaris maydis ATCC 48331]EMD88007.1 hypothetical protein COCHEDRAFT_1227261 [Bipolaris maydis C5]KAH7552234.1 hypothetical protein BM1_09096 [Bipolaris maydis]ENI03522.1 hypothetical protein COCC4DRAFT_200390 [Bipolaris maydis ATCC 48331]KAJ5024275.1 hypothetical protein J3E73DRAFT_8679 [Bipolaris maydis]KAJ5057678.1 hypothetical protein J3E74DRAFT_9452 [Bipolaris maydis]